MLDCLFLFPTYFFCFIKRDFYEHSLRNLLEDKYAAFFTQHRSYFLDIGLSTILLMMEFLFSLYLSLS